MKINRGINRCLHKTLILCDRIRLLLKEDHRTRKLFIKSKRISRKF